MTEMEKYLKEARKLLAAAIKAGDHDEADALRDLIAMNGGGR